MMPVFPIRLLLVFLPVAIAAGVLGLAASKGGGFLKNQGAAWFLTALMVVAAVFIGIGKSPLNNPKPEAAPAPNAAPPTALPEPGYSAAPVPGSSESFVWDNARVLSSQGAAVLLREADCVENTLYDEAALLLRERDRRENMVKALRDMAVPNAGEKIYETLRKIMK